MTSAISATSGLWATVPTAPTAPTQSSSLSTARDNVMTAVAGELGITQAQLQAQLQSGQSLAQVASAAGVSSDQLDATITNALQQSNLPPGTDISSLATKMSTHVGGHHHHHGGGGTPPTSGATSNANPSTAANGSSSGASSTPGIYL